VDLAHEANSIELENARNITRAWQTKCAAFDDVQADVASYHQRLAQSEAAREDLQRKLK
jgi:prophage DNA circulation protein